MIHNLTKEANELVSILSSKACTIEVLHGGAGKPPRFMEYRGVHELESDCAGLYKQAFGTMHICPDNREVCSS